MLGTARMHLYVAQNEKRGGKKRDNMEQNREYKLNVEGSELHCINEQHIFSDTSNYIAHTNTRRKTTQVTKKKGSSEWLRGDRIR